MTAIAPEARTEEAAPPASQFVQYLFLRVDPHWRRLPEHERTDGRTEFAEVIAEVAPTITTHAYSTLGLKTGAQLMLWWKSDDAVTVQNTLGALLSTGLGRYCEIAHSLWGLTRPSIYTKRRTMQEHAIDETTRLKYLIVYPFTKRFLSTPQFVLGIAFSWGVPMAFAATAGDAR